MPTTATEDGGTHSQEDLCLLANMGDADEVVRELVECHARLCPKLGIAP